MNHFDDMESSRAGTEFGGENFQSEIQWDLRASIKKFEDFKLDDTQVSVIQ